ncbi:MAG: endonuclease III [Opitutales bacterium]|nr:endonuclease III [Opitutales bacterium]
MTKKQRAEFIMQELDKLYPAPQIPLKFQNIFTFLIAVVLSAQCTDKRVNEVTPKLFAKANTPQKMAKLSQEEIAEIIKPCGLTKSKSANIKKLSQTLCERFDGIVPQSFEELESLAGVGHKTASVIMSQAFGKPAFPVDTHIHRLAKRWKLSNGKSVEQTEIDLKKTFPQQAWHNLHLQFIYYGREFCKAHTCKTKETLCPMCKILARK